MYVNPRYKSGNSHYIEKQLEHYMLIKPMPRSILVLYLI